MLMKQTEALKTAVELEIFTAIAEGQYYCVRLRNALQGFGTRRGDAVRFFDDSWLSDERGDAVWSWPPDSAVFLVKKLSPAYIGGAMEFMLTPRVARGHARLTEAVRGGDVRWSEGNRWCGRIRIG